MNITMAGIDYSIAQIDQRQKFSLTKSKLEQAYQYITQKPEILGCVIISTCNRTEIYLSLEDGASLNPFSLLCETQNADFSLYKNLHFTQQGDCALEHLCFLSCGAKSQIFGEDQIITQVKNAIAVAREFHAADSILEVMFRTAVSCAKKVKTEICLCERECSVADELLARLQDYQNITSVLVIGNGEIGRLCAAALAEKGYNVAMTLRRYKHHETIVPCGVKTIDYEKRYELFKNYDAVASATLSPHYTIEAQKLCELPTYPKLYFDLAVPRDIEKSVGALNGVSLFDVDTIANRSLASSHEAVIAQIKAYVANAKLEFYQWYTYRSNTESGKSRFPFYLNITDKKALVVGGGKIAQRRIYTLKRFAFQITVVAPTVTDEIKKLAKKGVITWQERNFCFSDCEDVFMIVAATNDRELNHSIAIWAKENSVLASIADCAEECSFFFPAIIDNGGITIAVSGDGKDHSAVSQCAKQLREFLNNEN